MPRNRVQQEVPDGHVRDERRVIDLRGVRVVQIEGIHIVETPDGPQTGRFTESDIWGYTGRVLALDESTIHVDPGARVSIEAVQRAVEEVRRFRAANRVSIEAVQRAVEEVRRFRAANPDVQDAYAKYVAPHIRGMTRDMFSVELLEAQAIARRLNFPPKPKTRVVQLDIEDPNYLSEQQQIEDC